MNVGIIGGTGTISMALTQKLIEQNIDLTLFHRNVGRLPGNRVKEVKVDRNDLGAMKKVLARKSFDVILDFVCFDENQAKDAVKLFKNKTKQYIFISTVATYDRAMSVIFDEASVQGNPHGLYGKNKEAAEKVFLKAFEETGFPVTIIRPSQTYDDTRIPLSVKGKTCYSVVSRMLKDKEVIVHGDGTSCWASMHSEDFASGIYPLLGLQETLGQIYQLTSEEVVSWNMIYTWLAKYLGVTYRPVYLPSSLLAKSRTYDFTTQLLGDKQYSVIFDCSKIKEIIVKIPNAILMEEGIKRYVRYIANHPESRIEDDTYDVWCDRLIQTVSESYKQIEQVL